MAPGRTELRRARVAAQLLDGRRPARSVEEILGAVVGVQAQDELAAALSIRARSTGLVRSDVDRCLIVDRSVVLTWSLRGTRHYHRAEDVRWLVGLLGPVFNRPGARARQLGIAGDVGERAVRALGEALALDGPLTRDEVKDRLAPLGVDPAGQAAIHVIHRAALEGLVVVVPVRGGKERYALLDDWLPGAAALAVRADPERAAGELARRYVAGYGPATVNDFTGWSGLPAKAARAAWQAIAGEAQRVARSEAEARAPLRLVGAFDNLILGYADRSAHLRADHAGEVNRSGGMVKPVVVDDGRIVGSWSYRSGGRVEVRPFPGLRVGRRAVEAEAGEVGRFLEVGQVRAEIPMPPGVVAP